jgi:two-component system, OmpR family, sensor kinase
MSIRLRLTLYWAIITAVILIVAGELILASFSRELWRQLDRALLEEADTSAATLAQSSQAQADAILRHLADEEDLGPGHRVRLGVGHEVVLDKGAQKTAPPLTLPQNVSAHVLMGMAYRYRWALTPLSFGGHPAWLEDGVDAMPTIRAIDHLRRTLLVLLPLILAMSVAGGYFLSAWALAPINSIAGALSRIGYHELKDRLPTPNHHDEARRLIDAINQLLARLEESSAAQHRFISEAAHELRTPLTVLRSGLEVTLRRPRTTEEHRLAMEDALHEVVRLCATAEDLLALARIETTEGANHSIVDIAEVVADVSRKMKALTESKHQTLTIKAATGLMVRGNGTDLERLVLNLLDNAIKFTPPQGRIEIAAGAEQQSVSIHVRDNGPGLAPQELSRIFDPFYRSSTAESEGSGLGLALCREIVRVHYGEISASNRRGGGFEIEVRLPSAYLSQLQHPATAD